MKKAGKTLKVSCRNDTKEMEFISNIQNANSAQNISSFSYDNKDVNFKDLSKLPYDFDGELKMEISWTKYNSANFVLNHCDNSFKSSGKAYIKEYVGGFAGHRLSEMNCTCSL